MSGIWATGLKKCSPTSLAGFDSFSASGSSVMLDVFVREQRSGLHARLELRVEGLLGFQVFEDALR